MEKSELYHQQARFGFAEWAAYNSNNNAFDDTVTFDNQGNVIRNVTGGSNTPQNVTKKSSSLPVDQNKVEKLYDGLLQQACSHSQPTKSPLNIRQNLSRNRETAFRVIFPNKNLPLKSFDDYAAKMV